MDMLFDNCPSDQSYRSKTIQNEIIEICGELITEHLIKEIREAKFFTILADDTTDCSNMEQLPIILRFVNKHLEVREEFLGFIPCLKCLTGEALSAEIKNFIQSYDGAGNMVGNFSGIILWANFEHYHCRILLY